MAGEPVITLVGNLTADPEIRFLPSGVAVANFTVASTPRVRDNQTNDWRDGETLFVRCTVWRRVAEHVGDSLTKGTRVIVTGRLSRSSYEGRDGTTRDSLQLDVDEIGPSLQFATAKVTRSTGGNSGGYQGGYDQNQWSGSAGGSSSENRGGGTDPWADAQSEVPPF